MPEQMITFNKYHARVIMIKRFEVGTEVQTGLYLISFTAAWPAVVKLFSFFQFFHKHFQLFNAQVIFFHHWRNNIAERAFIVFFH